MRADEDSLDGAREAVTGPQMKLLHQRGEGVVLEGRTERNAGVHGEVPNGTAEAEPIDEIYGHCLVDRIDGHDFIVHLGVVHVAIGKVNLAGVYVEGHDGSVVNHAGGISDLNEGAVVCITNRAGYGRGRRELRSGRTGDDVADW